MRLRVSGFVAVPLYYIDYIVDVAEFIGFVCKGRNDFSACKLAAAALNFYKKFGKPAPFDRDFFCAVHTAPPDFYALNNL